MLYYAITARGPDPITGGRLSASHAVTPQMRRAQPLVVGWVIYELQAALEYVNVPAEAIEWEVERR